MLGGPPVRLHRPHLRHAARRQRDPGPLHRGGAARLYAAGRFHTDPDYCETYGHDLLTGAERTGERYRAEAPGGRAFLHTVPYRPPSETTSQEHPTVLTTGRTVYHFHTRTKTGRAAQLNAAAPEVWAEINPEDAAALGVAEGDLLRLDSPRGAVQARSGTGRPAGTSAAPERPGERTRSGPRETSAPSRRFGEG